MNRRPPYAARLAGVLAHPETWPARMGTSADGRHLTLHVLAGGYAWGAAGEWSETAALFAVAPPDEDPAGFDWRALAGHPPVLVRPCGDLSRADESALVAALLRDGAGRVLVLGAGPMRLYRVEAVRRAA